MAVDRAAAKLLVLLQLEVSALHLMQWLVDDLAEELLSGIDIDALKIR